MKSQIAKALEGATDYHGLFALVMLLLFKFILLVAYIMWLACTLIFALSIVGWFVLKRQDNDCTHWKGREGVSPWYFFGEKILAELTR